MALFGKDSTIRINELSGKDIKAFIKMLEAEKVRALKRLEDIDDEIAVLNEDYIIDESEYLIL